MRYTVDCWSDEAQEVRRGHPRRDGEDSEHCIVHINEFRIFMCLASYGLVCGAACGRSGRLRRLKFLGMRYEGSITVDVNDA